MDHYIRLEDDERTYELPQQPSSRKLLIGYICQFVLYALIITYCILSPSLFSAISLTFMLLSFIFMLATPYGILRMEPQKTTKD